MQAVAWLRTRIAPWIGRASPLFYLCAVVMVASLILGGGTRGGFLSDAILQLLAIPLLLVSLWRIFEVPLTRQMRLALWFCLAIAVLPLLQLIPLPPWLWTALPNRQPSAETFDILGQRGSMDADQRVTAGNMAERAFSSPTPCGLPFHAPAFLSRAALAESRCARRRSA